ncbi:MAG TPA: sigma-70 family RNA polymerase sigma factor [Candidatus Solibacter sp.]|nr:sigma-70 family RNA polymerase sigma factor [Candidatus Solibacter sp.]
MAEVEPRLGGKSPDRELVSRFRAGDREAFLALYRAHAPSIFRYSLHMTADRMRAEEITQDVFVWLLHHAGEWDEARGALNAFLGGVARKLLLRQQRSDRRWTPLAESAAASSTWDGALEREQEAAALRRAIGALPERYREAVVLCDLEGKSYEETAAIQGCAVGTVRSRLHRARELLARKLQHTREGQRCL